MQKITIACITIFVASIASTNFASFDSCKDILQGGVRDELVNHNSANHKIARHEEFCSIAKQHNLNTDNFNTFAEDYANTVAKTNFSTGGGARVGYGPFSFGAEFSVNRGRYDQSAKARKNLLKRNRSSVLNYFTQHCGNTSYSEHLSTLAHSLSRVANSEVIKAWRSCMKERSTEFYSLLVHEPASSTSTVVFGWKSGGQNVQIQKIEMRWMTADLTFPSDILQSNDGTFSSSRNLCDVATGKLYDGDEIAFPFTRNLQEKSSIITVNSRTTVGNHRTANLIVARDEPPVSPVLDEEEPAPAIDTKALYYLQVMHSKKFLHVEGESTKNLAGVFQHEKTGRDNQKWQFESAGDGYFFVRANHSRKYLDVDKSGQANLQKVHQYEFLGTDNQKWKLEPAGDNYFYLVAKHSGKVLDVDESKHDNLIRVQQYKRLDAPNQKWKLKIVND